MLAVRRALRRAVPLPALLCALAAACGPGGGGDAPPPWKPAPVEWAPCEDEPTWECGWLYVPISYDEPAGAKYRQAVSRRKAAGPGPRLGALFVNPGGPGSPGIPYARGFAKMFAQTARRFDIVGLDPRGTGDSEPPLRWQSDEDLEADRLADWTRDATGLEAENDRLRAGFLDRIGPQALYHVATLDVARDLDTLREALGEERTNYVGASYGTFLGAVYASLFPQRVRAFVLDAGVDPAWPGGDADVEQARSIQDQLERGFDWCTHLGSCPAASVAELRKLWDQAFAALDAGTVTSPRGPATAQDLRQVTLSLLYSGNPSAVPTYLAQVKSGDGKRVVEIADAQRGRGEDGAWTGYHGDAFMAINCVDGLADATREDIDRAIGTIRQFSPRLGLAGALWTPVCLDWPVPARRPRIDAAGAPPILVIGGKHDPATPFAWSQRLVSALNNDSHLLANWSEGHCSLGRGRTTRRIARFLADPAATTGDRFECPGLDEPAPLDGTTETANYVRGYVYRGDATEVLVELRDPTDDSVLATRTLNGAQHEVRLPLPDRALRHVAVRVVADGHRTLRSYARLHYPVALDLGDYVQATFDDIARFLGKTPVPDLGLVRVLLVDCDDQMVEGARLLLDGQDFGIHTAGTAPYDCILDRSLSASTQCGIAWDVNVPTGRHTTAYVLDGRTFQGPDIVVEPGGNVVLVLSP